MPAVTFSQAEASDILIGYVAHKFPEVFAHSTNAKVTWEYEGTPENLKVTLTVQADE